MRSARSAGPGFSPLDEELQLLAGGLSATVPDGGPEGAPQARAHDLSYFSRLADAETFTRLAWGELHRRGLETAGTVCGVMDGADWEQTFLDVHRPDAKRILDFPHSI